MAMCTATHPKKICSKCEKGTGSFSCDGCQQSFCLKHVTEHRQELILQMDNIEQEHDNFHEDLLKQLKTQNEHRLFNQIDQWEKESIGKIEQIANESRTTLNQILDGINDFGQKSLNRISSKLRRARELDNFFENDLTRWTQQLNHLRAEIECMIKSIDITDTTTNSTSAIKFIKIVRDQTMETPDVNWNSPFSWFPDVKTLFYDRSQRLSSIEDKEIADCSIQTYAKSSIVISKVNRIDQYIDIENDGSNENDQNMTGWTLRRDLDKESKIIYKFPDDFILKRQSHVRILFDKKGAVEENDIEILFDEGIQQSWDTDSRIIIHLIDANGEEKASIIQTIESL